jgi:hypothetical protein
LKSTTEDEQPHNKNLKPSAASSNSVVPTAAYGRERTEFTVFPALGEAEEAEVEEEENKEVFTIFRSAFIKPATNDDDGDKDEDKDEDYRGGKDDKDDGDKDDESNITGDAEGDGHDGGDGDRDGDRDRDDKTKKAPPIVTAAKRTVICSHKDNIRLWRPMPLVSGAAVHIMGRYWLHFGGFNNNYSERGEVWVSKYINITIMPLNILICETVTNAL